MGALAWEAPVNQGRQDQREACEFAFAFSDGAGGGREKMAGILNVCHS